MILSGSRICRFCLMDEAILSLSTPGSLVKSAASCVHWLHVVWESSRGLDSSRPPQKKSCGLQNGATGIECPTGLGNATIRQRWLETRFVLFKSARETIRLLKKSANSVLAPFRPSKYPEGTPRAFTRCGLAGQPF